MASATRALRVIRWHPRLSRPVSDRRPLLKYHCPRGIMIAGSEQSNALGELRSGARREPDTPATTVELFDGLAARSQNRWPSCGQLAGIIPVCRRVLLLDLQVARVVLGAGLCASIRRAAGLGRASLQSVQERGRLDCREQCYAARSAWAPCSAPWRRASASFKSSFFSECRRLSTAGMSLRTAEPDARARDPQALQIARAQRHKSR